MKISASFLSCSDIMSAIIKLSTTTVDYIHVDFIDGEFVKGKKIPFRLLKKISKYSSKRLDIHLMTNKLDKYIKKFASLNCEYITFHIETKTNIDKYIDMIHNYGIKCGIAINPDTDINEIKPYLSTIDMVLVMSVVPGMGGQKFITETVDKIKKLKKYLVENNLNTIISVDGGINIDTIDSVNNLVDMAVSGSFITNSDNYQQQIDLLRK